MMSQRIRRMVKRFMFTVLMAVSLFSCDAQDDYTGYLFTYFTGNGAKEEQIHYAISLDGYNFRALNNNEPIIASEDISSSGGVRDPHILRSHDGKMFYMVVTDLYVTDMGWHNTAIILMKSPDLVHWESSVVNVPEIYPKAYGKVNRVWAPQTIYDDVAGKYMVYFSMKQRHDPDIIYYAYANEDFSGFESAPKQLYFSPTNNACIDGDIVKKDGKFYFFFKSEDGSPGIKLAISDKLTEGYKQLGSERIDKEVNNVEGSGVFKLNNSEEWILMYDVYIKGEYQFAKSKDLQNFEVIDHEISMDFHPRHGAVMPITTAEMKRLVKEWGTLDDPLIEVTSEQVKKLNAAINNAAHTIHLPVKSGTDLSHFNPQFKSYPGFVISPSDNQDFTQGAVSYTVSIEDGASVQYQVTAGKDRNPVLEGYYADPEILYSKNDKKFYIYPTSDGFKGWGGYCFKAFSSDNLVDWKEENVIIDLKTDVCWADRNAWAPCIEEKKIDDDYKYFYYFTAAQKIGVAVSDSPVGPFVDKGEPLIAQKPKGIKGGQEIDPDVFTDPVSGKSYLYWGNAYLAAVELNADMMSFDTNAIKLMTPDGTFREGVYVFYRQGKYYFLWSEDDTRSPNYKVRYAIASSPLGELHIPEHNIVIQKRPEEGIYGAGHNSILQLPDSDQWYIVYHRFTVPKGITMGRDAGFHREVCIDELRFDEEGNIIEVIPTLGGITAINL